MLYSEHGSLVVSLISLLCVTSDCYLVECCKLAGLKCLIDLCFEMKKDYVLHHGLVIVMAHYLNEHSDIETTHKVTSVILSTEISTIFLSLDNLLENSVAKNLNKMAFVSTFYYYRIYNYSFLLLDKNVNTAFYVHSRNNFEYCEIYFGIYGLFLLNLYWATLIYKKCIRLLKK